MSARIETIAIRHGETTWNIEQRIQGHGDSPLTELGIRQAQAVAARLREQSLDAVYASDLARAVLTAQPIVAGRDLELKMEPALRERSFGVFEGLTLDEIGKTYPEEFAAYTSGNPDYRIPGGESQRQFWHRCTAFLSEIVDRHAGQSIVLVLHGGVLNIVVKHVLGLPMGNTCPFRLYNAAINRMVFEAGAWKLDTLGDINHLENVTAFEASVY